MRHRGPVSDYLSTARKGGHHKGKFSKYLLIDQLTILHNETYFIKHCDLVQGPSLVKNLTCAEASVRIKVLFSVSKLSQ